MIELAATEQRVREALVARAKAADPANPLHSILTRGQLCAAVDPDQAIWRWPHYRGIGAVLKRVSAFEAENSRPMLSALVVRQQSRDAGSGFAALARELGRPASETDEQAFWREQVAEVVRYWAGREREARRAGGHAVAEARARLDRVMEELAAIRRLLDEAA